MYRVRSTRREWLVDTHSAPIRSLASSRRNVRSLQVKLIIVLADDRYEWKGAGEETSYFEPHRCGVRINSRRLLERAKPGSLGVEFPRKFKELLPKCQETLRCVTSVFYFSKMVSVQRFLNLRGQKRSHLFSNLFSQKP